MNVCMCLCMCECVQVHMQMCVFVCWGQKLTSLSITFPLIWNRDHLMLGLQTRTAPLGFHTGFSVGAKDSDSGPMLVQQVHYQKSHRLNPIGQDLNFIFLVMAVLLIYLHRFFSGLFMCVGGGDEYMCWSVWEMFMLLRYGDTRCAGACGHVCTCVQRPRIDVWGHLQLLSILYTESGSLTESWTCHAC